MSLTSDDKNFIENLLDRKLDQQELKFEAKLTQFKDEFYTRIDPILKEVKDSRDERAIQSDHLKNHSDRIEKLENLSRTIL